MNNKGWSLEQFTQIVDSLSLIKEQSISLSEANKKKFLEMCNQINTFDNAKDKGNKLENLVCFIVDNTPIFEKGYQNIRTSTNEVDIIIRLSDIGKMMLANNLIDLKANEILVECKNYDKQKIDVTWVGKFCSLLLQSPARVGILISHKGFKGRTSWDSAKGLAKKFYYYKEKYEEKQYVLDITLDELKKYVEDNSFVELISSKIIGLENDTRFEHFISKHPAEDDLLYKIKSDRF